VSNPVRVKGLDGLDRKLKQLPPKMRGRTLRKALRAGAKIVERDAKSRVSVLSGRLKRNLTTKVHEDRAGNQHATVGANMPDGAHIHLVEFGTSNRVLTGKGKYPAGVSRGAMPEQPFLRPAFDSRKDAALSAVGKELDRAITRAIR
jgi:HK97 gp10 family phage protein